MHSVVIEFRLELEPDSTTVVLKNVETRSNSLELARRILGIDSCKLELEALILEDF